MQRTSGFTLIELVIVLVILGVLAAVAVPQLSGTADNADAVALDAQAGAISSANSTNVANDRLGSTPVADIGTSCSTGVENLATKGLLDKDPNNDFTVESGSSSGSSTGSNKTIGCVIKDNGNSESFTLNVTS